MVPPDLLHCDLCILAYQLYHQSLIWPLDPWYEFAARKLSSRRDSLMALLHRYEARDAGVAGHYGGPASLRGFGPSNTRLDPVITNYARIAPRLPAWTRDGTRFLAARAPAYVVDRIRKVSLASYAEAPRVRPGSAEAKVIDLREELAGTDHLIAFEGGTGGFKGEPPAWSLMGYVLKRTRENGGFDVHVVFRGSRSGSAVRAAVQGVARHGGNPDWVTDTDSELVADPIVSRAGLVHRGFATAVKTCLGSIQAALAHVHRLYGAPAGIGVTGHSLGAGLAAQFTACIYAGEWGEWLRSAFASWPWDSLRGYFMAEPPVGDEACAAAVNAKTAAHAPYVLGDAVVECSAAVGKASTMTGKVMSLAAHGVQIGTLAPMERVAGAQGSEDSHETYMIRGGLLAKHGHEVPPAVASATPWAYYDSFSGMVGGTAVTWIAPGASKRAIVDAENLVAVLGNYKFADEFAAFLDVYRAVVTNPDAYRLPKLLQKKADRAEKAERLAVATSMIGKNDSDDPAKVVDVTVTQILALAALDPEGAAHYVQGKNTHLYLGLGLILGVIEKAKRPIAISLFAAEPELRECLESTWAE